METSVISLIVSIRFRIKMMSYQKSIIRLLCNKKFTIAKSFHA